MVARDSDGSVYFCAVTRCDHVDSSFHADMKVIYYGLELALEHGLRSLQIESGSLMAIKEIYRHRTSLINFIPHMNSWSITIEYQTR